MPAIPAGQRCWLALGAIGVPLSGWGASYPPNTWLQVGPVAVAVIAAIPALRRWPLSTGAVGCVAAFLLLHMVAAHWTYSDVPYDRWAVALTGSSIDQAFGFRRNMFDRLVHFSFGLSMMMPLAEVLRRYGGDGRRRAIIGALAIVLAVSAAYEIFEWLLALSMDPADAAAYNGQQGDVFDSAEDMAMAALGAVVWIGVEVGRRPRAAR